MKRYMPVVIIIALTLALLHQCSRANRIISLANANAAALTDTIYYYKNSLGTITASVKTLNVEKNQLESLILDKDIKLQKLAKEFVKLKSVTAFTSIIRFDTIAAKFSRPIMSSGNDTVSKFERFGTITGKWYRLGYHINNDSLIIKPFQTWTETTAITGFKRKWLLGRQTAVTDITNTNPYITITSVRAAEVIVPEQWYKKWYIWLAAGVAAGLFLK